MMGKDKGFTLIEVMIVVAVVAIIAAIAYPSYQRQVARTTRADAHAALTDLANRQEQYFYDHRAYTTNTGSLGLPSPYLTENGHYRITIAAADGAIANGFLATATAQGVQASRDSSCLTITINHRGEQGGASAECWR